jgi:hypothetical protein
MNNLRTDIAAVIKDNKDPGVFIKEVSYLDYDGVLDRINTEFLTTNKYGDASWWWTVYKKLTEYCIHFRNGNGFEALTELFPLKGEKYWFIASEENGKYWLYEATIESIQWLIANMYGFEYYIVDKKYKWILCENHHDILIGLGQEITERLKAYEVKERYYGELKEVFELEAQGLILSLQKRNEKKTLSIGNHVKILFPNESHVLLKIKGVVFNNGDVLVDTDLSKEDFSKGSTVLLIEDEEPINYDKV